MLYSIIIPVYNGEQTVEKLYDRIKQIFADKYNYEVIFVYDCGKDNSWEDLLRIKSRALKSPFIF